MEHKCIFLLFFANNRVTFGERKSQQTGCVASRRLPSDGQGGTGDICSSWLLHGEVPPERRNLVPLVDDGHDYRHTVCDMGYQRTSGLAGKENIEIALVLTIFHKFSQPHTPL